MRKEDDERTDAGGSPGQGGAERDAAAARSATSFADQAAVAASAAEGAAVESEAATRVGIEASQRAGDVAQRARQAATAAHELADSSNVAGGADNGQLPSAAEAGDAPDAKGTRDRMPVAQSTGEVAADQSLETYKERLMGDGETAEFETYNEFIGPTLEVSVDQQLVEATPILGNRGFRLASAPPSGSEVRVDYQVATF